MNQLKVMGILCLAGILITGFISRQQEMYKINYPEGYRQWTHIKSNIVGPSSPAAPKYEGFTHIYANAKAMTGYKSGKFPNGSVIVFDVMESVSVKTGIKEGSRKFIDVMVRDSALYASSGGWGFEEFDKDTKTTGVLTADEKGKCFGCHTSQKGRDYVFSGYRE